MPLLWKTNICILLPVNANPTTLGHFNRLYLVYILLLIVGQGSPCLPLAEKVANSTPTFLIIDQSYAAWY
jgi:hypothetical protein